MKTVKRNSSQSAPAVHGGKRKNHGVLIVAGLALMTVVFYWPLLSGQGVIWNDFIEQYFPYRHFASLFLKQGQFPFWNPYVFSGMPFFADLQTAVLYPLNLLLVPLSGSGGLNPIVFQYQIVLHVLGAGLFMYLLCREFGCGKTAGVVAAFSYMFGGFITTHIFHVTMIHMAPWFPLLILFLKRTVELESLLYCALSALVMACAALAGHPQLFIYMGYWLGGYLLFQIIMMIRTHIPRRRIATRVVLFSTALVTGGGIAAVQYLPAQELGRESARPSMEFRQSAEGSFRPYRLITLIAPNYFGTPNRFGADRKVPYWGMGADDISAGPHYYWETAVYVGIVPLLFALLAAVVIRTPLMVFLSSMAGLSLLLAMGDSFPLYRLFYSIVPGIGTFRLPGRFSFLFGPTMALMAGMGLQWILDQKANAILRKILIRALPALAGVLLLWAMLHSAGVFRQGMVDFLLSSGFLGRDPATLSRAVDELLFPGTVSAVWTAVVLSCAALILVVLFLSKKISSRSLVFVLLTITVVDFFLFGYGYAAIKTPPGRLYPETPDIRTLRRVQESEFSRINSRASSPGTDDLGGRHMLFHKNAGSMFRLFLMEGYNPLRLKRQLVDRKDRTLDILNVRYKIAVDENANRMGLAPHPTGLSRARMVYNYRVVENEDQILPALHDESFDHVHAVILEQAPGVPALVGDAAPEGKARIHSFSINRIEVDVETSQPGLLVLGDIHYPAWKARVGGEPAKLLRANYALRAIVVPAGSHRVICWYDSDMFRAGSVVSLLSLAGVAAMMIAGLRRRPRADA